jgi:ABC-type transport system substrate-binding protein
VNHRFKKPKLLLFTPLLLALALVISCGTTAPEPSAPEQSTGAGTPATAIPGATDAPVATAAPQPADASAESAQPVVDRLRVAFTIPPKETNLPWSGPRSLLTQLSPMVETLLDIDPDTGEYVPMLATRWEMAPDGKSWTMDLREGVAFHNDFGTFDAKDVVHMRNLMGPQEGNLNSFRNTWATTVENVEVVDDHRVVFQLSKPDPDLDFFFSQSGDLVMFSKAHWDQDGEEGVEDRLVATGPYQYLEREVGQSIIYERVSYEHWRIPMADFREIEQVWAPESATRLAMLLTGEAHMAELPRDVLAQAAAEGMAIAESGLGAILTWIKLGGQYYTTGDETYDASVPFAEPGEKGRLVRQALNKAVNRDEINEFIFKQGGTPMLVHGYHPTLPGWNPEWETRWEEEYGYDPEAAMALLAEAGYPDGFKMKMYGSHTLPGVPELPDIAEAVSIFWTAIGIDVEIVSLEFSAVRPLYRTKQFQGYAAPFRTVRRPLQEQVRLFNLPDGVVHQYETDTVVDKWEQLSLTLDPSERDSLTREIGNEKFDNFSTVPILWIFFQVAIDPDVISEYKFPGTAASNFSHMETIKAVR